MEETNTAHADDNVDPPNVDVHNMFLRVGSPGKKVPDFSENPDSHYAYNNVGKALVMALSEVAAIRPQDPIEYVAERLKNYRATIEYCKERDEEFSALRQARIKQREEEAKQRAIDEEIRRQKELEEQRQREELEQKRSSIPIQAVALPRREDRDKSGSTPLHQLVKDCNVEAFIDCLHNGQSFSARDAQGQNVRDAAAASKNEIIVKEIDNLIISWIKEDKVEYLKWLIISGYAASLPNLKKVFGPKLKSVPERCREVLDSIPQIESRQNTLWRLSAKGTQDHLNSFLSQNSDNLEEVFAINGESQSAIHLALLCKNQDTASELINSFPKFLHMQDGFGRIPLHYAHGAGPNFVEMIHSAGGAAGEDVKDAFGFVPSVYARRFDLLPEAPTFESPDLIVTEDSGEIETKNPEGADDAPKDDSDQSKLTPINEDEAEEN